MAKMEPRDSFASTSVRRTILTNDGDGSPGTFSIQENGDRVVISFIVDTDVSAFLVPICPTDYVHNEGVNDPSGFFGYFIADQIVGVNKSMMFTFGDHGSLVQGGWEVKCTLQNATMTVVEVFDNPPTRKALSCVTIRR